MKFAVPDPLARHCHASEGFVNNAQSLVSATTSQTRVGEDQFVEWRNRHECSRGLSLGQALANLLDGRCAGSCFGEGPAMENSAGGSPGRQVLLFREVDETLAASSCRGCIPFELVLAARPTERDGDRRRMGDALSERNRRIAGIVSPDGITQ